MGSEYDPERHRLADAADRMEITELLHRYAHAIDSANLALLAEVFTPEATLDFGSVDEYVEGDSVVKGLATIRAWFEKALAPFPDVLHFMTNHRIELAGDEARTETLMQVLHMSMGGIYRGHAVRTLEVAGMQGGGEAVSGAIGGGDGLFLCVKRPDRDDRPKDFLLVGAAVGA